MLHFNEKSVILAAPKLSCLTPAILECELNMGNWSSRLLVCTTEDNEAFSSSSSQDIICEAFKQSVNALKYHFKDNLLRSFSLEAMLC